jgi:cardiolipin hydrolase
MNPFESLEAAFRQSFADKFFSKAERDALRQQFVAARLDQRNRDVLRSKLYEMARAVSQDKDVTFAFEWLEAATRVLEDKVEQPKQSGSVVHFSPGDACLNAIISQIAAAKKALDVCVFTISDDRITDALVERHKSRVKVRILTDNEKLMDIGSDIERLVKAGIPVKVDRTEHHMHHKYAVVDGVSVVTGSYNWTRSAAQFNQENIMITTEQAVVQSYLREFEKMWAKMDPY